MNPRLFISKNLTQIMVWFVVVILFIWVLFPLVWTFLSTFKEPLDVYDNSKFLPTEWSLDNYKEVIFSDNFFRFSLNSLIVTVLSTLLSVVCSVLGGYAFARYAFRFRHILLMLLLVPRIIPRASLTVPLYMGFDQIGLLNTYSALIISYTATAIPMGVWIMAGFFKGIPKSLEEAAVVDGAKPWQMMLYVLIPLTLPGILTVSIFSVREAWNEFPFALTLTTSTEMRTLPYQLYMLSDSMGIQNWPVINTFALMTILPILIVYLIFEKRIVNGIVSGSVK